MIALCLPAWLQHISRLWTDEATYNFASSEWGGLVFHALELLTLWFISRIVWRRVMAPYFQRIHAHLECNVEGCSNWGHPVHGPDGQRTPFIACKKHNPHHQRPLTAEMITRIAKSGHTDHPDL